MSTQEAKYFRTCNTCDGTGKNSGQKCTACNGLKIVFSQDGLEIEALFAKLNALPSFHIDSLRSWDDDKAS
jgi:hypothetical protein